MVLRELGKRIFRFPCIQNTSFRLSVMASIVGELTARRVTCKDYDKVMAIRKREDVYDGLDYLPSYFQSLVGSENVMAFAAVHGDKFVAFDLAFFVDEGETVVTRAARVSKQYEGKGVMLFLATHILEVITSTNAALNHVYAVNSPTDKAMEQIKRAGYDTILEKKGVDFLTNTGTISNGVQVLKHQLLPTKRIDRDDLERVLDNPDVSSCLFNQQSIVVDRVPFRPIKSNVPLMLTPFTSVIGSDLEDNSNALITFGNHFQISNGVMLNVDMYGNLSDSIYVHLLQHIESCNGDNVLIRLFYDDFPESAVNGIVKKLSISDELQNYFNYVWVKRNLRDK